MTPTMLVDGEGRSYVRYDEWMSTDAQLAEALRQGDCLRRDLAEAKRHLAAVVNEEREEAYHDVLAEALDCGCARRIVARLRARWTEEANHDPH